MEISKRLQQMQSFTETCKSFYRDFQNSQVCSTLLFLFETHEWNDWCAHSSWTKSVSSFSPSRFLVFCMSIFSSLSWNFWLSPEFVLSIIAGETQAKDVAGTNEFLQFMVEYLRELLAEHHLCYPSVSQVWKFNFSSMFLSGVEHFVSPSRSWHWNEVL